MILIFGEERLNRSVVELNVSWEDGWVVATVSLVGRPILSNIMVASIITHIFVYPFLIYLFWNECMKEINESYVFMNVLLMTSEINLYEK